MLYLRIPVIKHTFSNKVNPGERSTLVLSDRLVELVILAVLNLSRLAGPDGLRLVAQLPVPSSFVNL